jgi:mercuric ion binding protein
MDRTAARVKKALMKEQGVASVTVSYEKKELIVSFDDAKTIPDTLMKSTAAVGFPSQIAR